MQSGGGEWSIPNCRGPTNDQTGNVQWDRRGPETGSRQLVPRTPRARLTPTCLLTNSRAARLTSSCCLRRRGGGGFACRRCLCAGCDLSAVVAIAGGALRLGMIAGGDEEVPPCVGVVGEEYCRDDPEDLPGNGKREVVIAVRAVVGPVDGLPVPFVLYSNRELQ